MSRKADKHLKMLKDLARELERNGKQYSADEQALISRAAVAVAATTDRNLILKYYSYNEDD